MGIEIIDAICEYYKDDESSLVDCLMYLRNKINDFYINTIINQTLNEMNRCIDCGTKLELYYYKEWHPEINTSETLADIYCPHCDIKHK